MAELATAAESRPTSRMTAEREREVLDAVVDVLAEVGFDMLTMEAVALRARCGKATLYRQWGSKDRLVAHALRTCSPTVFGARAVSDTGTLAGDIEALAHHAALTAKRDTLLVTGVSRVCLVAPELGSAVRCAVINPFLATVRDIVARAVRRGELTQPSSAFGPPEQLFAMLAQRPLLEGVYADEAFVRTALWGTILPERGFGREQM
ncbi:TetR/AcrR family transcriptional regulator [Streptomyces sp. NPDC098781]|uniref:TetR/AcrR family transcriptional regulator n=1 Tax=Streptomyces sp. NPDC098781 TaxID=3366097 RepID=UPI0037FFC89F